jgi:hypothetical protein
MYDPVLSSMNMHFSALPHQGKSKTAGVSMRGMAGTGAVGDTAS